MRIVDAQIVLQVTNLTFEQYEKMWKMFVDALSGLLLACEGRYEEGTPTARRLTQLSTEAGFLHVAMALAHPSRIASYHFSMGQVRLHHRVQKLLDLCDLKRTDKTTIPTTLQLPFQRGTGEIVGVQPVQSSFEFLERAKQAMSQSPCMALLPTV